MEKAPPAMNPVYRLTCLVHDLAFRERAAIGALVKAMDLLRSQQLYEAADEIRRRLTDMGVVVEQGSEGSHWRYSIEINWD